MLDGLFKEEEAMLRYDKEALDYFQMHSMEKDIPIAGACSPLLPPFRKNIENPYLHGYVQLSLILILDLAYSRQWNTTKIIGPFSS